jgi:hypothetical protein
LNFIFLLFLAIRPPELLSAGLKKAARRDRSKDNTLSTDPNNSPDSSAGAWLPPRTVYLDPLKVDSWAVGVILFRAITTIAAWNGAHKTVDLVVATKSQAEIANYLDTQLPLSQFPCWAEMIDNCLLWNAKKRWDLEQVCAFFEKFSVVDEPLQGAHASASYGLFWEFQRASSNRRARPRRSGR